MKIKRKIGAARELEIREYQNEEGTSLPVLEFSAFEKTGLVRHFFTTRMGGVSPDIWESMNLSFSRGDDPERVRENYKRIAHALDTDLSHIVTTAQVHHANVRRVYAKDGGAGLTKEREWDDLDGIVTNEPGLVLATFFADCVPIMMLDPVHRAIGSCHSGWRGTVSRIGENMVKKMTEEFGTDPKDLICVIGPSICQDCYEVSDDVAEQFKAEFPGHESEILSPGAPGHAQLNLWEACRIGLEDAGVPGEQIHLPDICTCCNPDLMFSHRASGGQHGNFAGFLMITE